MSARPKEAKAMKSPLEVDLEDFTPAKPIRQRSRVLRLPSGSGVYALMLETQKPGYIGISSDVGRRVKQHKVFLPPIFYLCDESSARLIEARLVGKYNPPFNKLLRTGPDSQIKEATDEKLNETSFNRCLGATPTNQAGQVAGVSMLPGFVSVVNLWAGADPVFLSENAARWALRIHRDSLIDAKAIALFRNRMFIHPERLVKALGQLSIESAKRQMDTGLSA